MGSVVQAPAGRHVYELGTGLRAFYLFLAVFLCGLSVLLVVRGSGREPLFLVAVGMFGMGLYLGLSALRSQLVIDGTHVEVRGAVRTREFELHQVEGLRTFKNRSGSYRVICLSQGAGTISLQNYGKDESLDRWLAGLKDLDAEDREQLLEKIDQDAELGATPEERRGALRGAKQLSIGVCVVDVLAAAALLFGPEPYRLMALTVAALAPAAAAYLLYRQPMLYALFKSKADPRADLTLVLVISGVGLLLGGSRVNFISYRPLVPYIALAAAASIAMFFPAVRKNPRFGGTLVGLCAMSAFYGWGLAAAADTVADRSAPQTYSAEVVGGHVSHGRSTSYYLELGPWGPAAVATSMSVGRSTYYATQRGEVLCLSLHAGALHVPWYERVSCEGGE
ncbi:MAG: hypothetical protein ACLGXA_17125 [Acidobacteriota bacterium]